jgi:hypothetical protein
MWDNKKLNVNHKRRIKKIPAQNKPLIELRVLLIMIF